MRTLQLKPLLRNKKDQRQLTVANRPQTNYLPTNYTSVGCVNDQFAAISYFVSEKGTFVNTKK